VDTYAKKFAGSRAVARYHAKFDNHIERMRHAFEHAVLQRHMHGRLFDCTIGTGRFIGTLSRVGSYSGLDLSVEFVEHVKASFPSIAVRQGDLRQGIPEPANSYDSVMCLRSLSAIGHLDAILPEMIRIVRPGGVVIFDYGRYPTSQVLNGETFVIDGEDVESALARLEADVVQVIKCDALLTRIKKSRRAYRWIASDMGRLVPHSVLLAVEGALVPWFWERQIIVLRKRGSFEQTV
jgi:ubiquinone/menaquinone biosynthesis C-methylase UbiE